ncbi:alpha/beta hydrolase [Neorhodopirellula pilleata]|uniref:Alpha/beta hydrolase family protein n=1 Tax=Neorhodopirellula pilleata TaxID=2714738 RepID=A0A5C6AR44_9BACT|nr:alpha/beta hydrolase [Neorhodopirellula pilleata]TWU02028.1 hypothetical protein Pla100_17640 [Neorhodopirellula pilleata]
MSSIRVFIASVLLVCGLFTDVRRSAAQFDDGGLGSPSAQLGDEIWLVSSRHLGSRNCDVESLEVRQYADGQWYSSTPQTLLSAEMAVAAKPTVILVHGNSWSLSKAIQRGLQTYRQVFLPWRDKPPIRFIIWTWPSDRIPGPIRDIRIKADLAEDHSFHLAKFLQRIPVSSQVSMIGYSYGSRVTLGALNLLGGGSINGARIAATQAPTPRINLTLIAPAIRNDALFTSVPHAFGQLNHLFVMYNRRDRYLSLFRFTRFSGKTPAMGYTGLACAGRLPGAAYRIDQFDAARAVGPDHDYLEYIRDRNVEQRLRRNLLYAPVGY